MTKYQRENVTKYQRENETKLLTMVTVLAAAVPSVASTEDTAAVNLTLTGTIAIVDNATINNNYNLTLLVEDDAETIFRCKVKVGKLS